MSTSFHLDVRAPLRRLDRGLREQPLARLLAVLVGLAWAPLPLLALAQRLVTGRVDPLLRDLALHARLLVALPLFLVAERVLGRLGGVAFARLDHEGFLAPAPHLRSLYAHLLDWRDSRRADALLFALVLAAGVASLFGVRPRSDVLGGYAAAPDGAVRLWYALVSLPLFRFFLLRSLFHWALWVRLLAALAHAPLHLLPVHADRRAGIGFLKEPTTTYCAVMLLALSTVLCAGWATQMIVHGAPLSAFQPLFLAFVLVGLVAAVAPLLLFVPQLVRARVHGLRQYGALVSEYTQRFQVRWIDRAPPDDMLGHPDFQSLADLGSSYRDNVEKLQVLLLTPLDGVLLLVGALVPAVPLLFVQRSAHEVLGRLLHLVIGGLPG